MSSDETETEWPKTVRRVQKSWISPDIGNLWRQVDKYYTSRISPSRLKPGNKPLPRVFMARHCNEDAEVVPGLPRNFYSSSFLAALSSRRRRELEIIEEDIPLPYIADPSLY